MQNYVLYVYTLHDLVGSKTTNINAFQRSSNQAKEYFTEQNTASFIYTSDYFDLHQQ